MHISIPAGLLAASLTMATSAHAVTVDFSGPDFMAGSVPTSTTIGDTTISFRVENSRTNEIRVIDTNSSSSTTGTGNDPDLLGPFQSTAAPSDPFRTFGHGLIIQEGGTSTLIDDEGQGGSMFLTFSQPVTLGQIAMLDIDSTTLIFVNGGTTEIASGKTSSHGKGSPTSTDNNQWFEFTLNEPNVNELEIQFVGSGALGEFTFEPTTDLVTTPLPAGMPLLMAGAAALTLVSRRRT